jgi:hypothetical protein
MKNNLPILAEDVKPRPRITTRPVDLCLHAGARRIEREQLAHAPTPQRTETWCPIAHDALVREAEAGLNRAGFSVIQEVHALTEDSARYFGLFQVADLNAVESDYAFVVGLRNSHDQRFPAALCLGSQVFVCDNLAFAAEVKIARRHTRYIERDLPEVVGRAIGRLADFRTDQGKRFDTYREAELGHEKAHDLIIKLLDAKAITQTQLPDVLTEWRTPRHPEFSERQNVWRLFNACTEAVKGSLWKLPTRTQALQGILDGHCGLLSDAERN